MIYVVDLIHQLPFQIPRNPPPGFKDEQLWGAEFVDFVRECLIKDFEERPVSIGLF